MKRTYFLLQSILLSGFVFALFFSICEISGTSGGFKKFNYDNPRYDGKEEFDPSLSRLNNVDIISTYCDSLYNSTPATAKTNFYTDYTNVVRKVVRKRFYHGYSTYGFGNNYIALLGEVFYKKGISSIVIPDELLKYPFAACSQQSIVVMEILKRKKFVTRKVGFPPVGGAGHFCLEVYYDKNWHFVDPDMEPSLAVLAAYNYPDANFLAANKDIIRKAYANSDPERAVALFSGNIFYGTPNTFPASIGKLYQTFSRVLSYSLWLFLGILFILVRRKYLSLSKNHVRNSRIYFPQLDKGTSSVHYPDFATPGA